MKTKIMTGFKLWSVSLLSVLILVVMGCGQKGPPQPYSEAGKKIMEPYDLVIVKKDDTALVRWSHRIDPVDAYVKPDRFDLFVARKTLDGCESCPFKFQLFGSVPSSEKEMMVPVQKGYKYYFRVQAVGDDEFKSPYSKTVHTDHRPE